MERHLGGGFKYFLFSPLFGEDEPILTSIFFRWVVQPPPSHSRVFFVAQMSWVLGSGDEPRVCEVQNRVCKVQITGGLEAYDEGLLHHQDVFISPLVGCLICRDDV